MFVVCMLLCLYVCMLLYLYVCMFLCLYACMFVCLHVCRFVCMYVCIFLCLYGCMFVWFYVFIYLSMYVCMFVFFFYPALDCLNFWTNCKVWSQAIAELGPASYIVDFCPRWVQLYCCTTSFDSPYDRVSILFLCWTASDWFWIFSPCQEVLLDPLL